MDFPAPPRITSRRFNDLEYLQHIGALEAESGSRRDIEDTGLAFHSVTGERGQRILRLWRLEKEKGPRHE